MTSSARPANARRLPAMHALASAVVLALGLTAGNAWALALGRATVQSHLGEPLRAEIDIPSITPQEAASLQVSIASAQALRAANMEYNPLLGHVQIRLQQRTDGRTVLRLESDQPVNEPFLDMALEAQWASGRLLRFYTMLFDPPNLKPAAPEPLLPAPMGAAAPKPAPMPTAPAMVAPQIAQPILPRAAVPATKAQATETPSPTDRVTVRRGDTAWRIAYNHRQPGVSLDQMLLAMLRANPDAFMGNNVNRMKAGAVLEIPSGNALTETGPEEAQQLIAAQSRDFNEYRRRLASTAPKTVSEPSGRSAKGVVQTEVSEKKPATPEVDKLTLSKGTGGTKADTEEKIARARQQDDTQTRMTELSRNIEELKKLSEVAPQTATTPAAPAPAPAAPAEPSPPAAPAPQPPVSVETASTVAQAPAEQAPAPAAPPTPATQPTAPPPPPPPSTPTTEGPGMGAVLGTLLDNPMTLPAAGGLVALLGLLALVRMRKKKSAAASTSSFLESHNASDSFFNASGGQTVDTSTDTEGPSSMMYSLSQLDISGDVDRLAEADVLLAYGREDEAESVLRDALRTQPERTALHLKLLEIHALRQNKAAFEATASEVYTLTGGTGADWQQVCEMGQTLDAGNPLYASTPTSTEAEASHFSEAPSPDLDLDLDLSQEASASPASPAAEVEETPLAVDADTPEPQPSAPAEEAASVEPQDTIEFDMDLSEGVTSQESAALAAVLQQEPAPELDEPTPELEAPVTEEAFSVDFALPVEEPSPAAEEPASMALDVPADEVPAAADSAEEEIAFDLDLTDIESTDASQESAMTTASAEPMPATPPAFDLEDISLELDTPAEPADEPVVSELDDLDLADEGDTSDPLVTKLSLAREFQVIGDIEGARSLAEEVEAEASGDLKERARAFLARLA